VVDRTTAKDRAADSDDWLANAADWAAGENRPADSDDRLANPDDRSADADDWLDADRRDPHDGLDPNDRLDSHDWAADNFCCLGMCLGRLQQAVADRQPRGRQAHPKGQPDDFASSEHVHSPRKKRLKVLKRANRHWFALPANLSVFRSACASTFQA
jgi:hypothetical protein